MLFFQSFGSFGQNAKLDSLKLRVELESDDSIRGSILNELAWEFKFRDLGLSESYCNQVIALSTKTGQIKQRSSAYNTLGLVRQEQNQYTDALKYLDLSVKDKEKINDKKGLATVKNNIAIVYKNLGEMDRALSMLQEALKEHESIGNIRGQAESISNIAVIYRNKGELDKSTEFFMQSLELNKKLNNKNGIAIVYNNLSANATDQNDYTKSVDYLYEAARLFEEMGNKTALVTVYANIALLNRELKNGQTALKYCYKSIELAKEIEAEQNVVSAYAVLGDVQFEKKQIAKAKQAYSKGLKLMKGAKNSTYESHCHLGLGSCFLEEKNFEKALPEITKAVFLARKYEQERPLARSLQKLGKYYVDSGEPEKAKKPLNESIRIAKKHDYKELLALSYSTFANLHTDQKDEEKADAYLNKVNRLNDSIFTKDVASNFAEMHTRYETEKKEAAIKSLKQQKKINALQLKKQKDELFRQRIWLFVSIFALIFASVLGLIIFSNQRLKAQLAQNEIQKKTEEEERTRIAKDIHDELGSGLSKIMFLSEAVSQLENDENKRDQTLKSISNTARSLIENMRDLIWALNPENSTLENLIVRIREYSSDYLEDISISLKIDVPDDIPERRLSNEQSRNIFMLVKEALQNTVKHAGASTIGLSITLDPDFKITLSDDGKGFDPLTVETGNGLRNLKYRSELIGAKLTIDSSPKIGTRIAFSMPIAKS